MNLLPLLIFSLLFFAPSELPYLVDHNPEHELIIFEGSDWCANCNTLNKKILDTSSFRDYIENSKISLIKVDFPQRKKQTKEEIEQNIKLAEKYKFDGNFPMIVIRTKDNEEFKTLVYSSSFTVKDLESQITEYISKQK